MPTYPGASKAQWFADDFASSTWTTTKRTIGHSTETIGWPGYNGGAVAPNITGKPNCAKRIIEWRAHFDACESSRALKNLSGGVETNTDSCYQVELCGTTDPKVSAAWKKLGKKPNVDYIEWYNPPDWALTELAKHLIWVHKTCGMSLKYWGSNVRMNFAQWRAFRGFAMHVNTPENTHWDITNFPWLRFIRIVENLMAPSPTTTTSAVPTGEEDNMYVVTYNGGAYLIGGLMRRHIPWTEGQVLLSTLIKAYGPARAITSAEMNLYTPIDTVLAIQGAVAKQTGLVLTGQAAIAADLDELQDVLDTSAPKESTNAG